MAQVNLSEIQKAVFAKINTSSIATALGGSGKIYDRVPDGVKLSYPYITFGSPVTIPRHNMDTAWMDMLFQVDVWHRDTAGSTGKKKVYDIQDLIRSLLDRQRLTISGANHLYTQERTVTILDGSDGITYHGVQVFAIGASPAL
jgi:hypothetical protein